MRKGKLTALAVSKLKTPGKHRIDDNLYLQIAKTKRAARGSWLYRYMHDGRDVWMGLGACRLVTLAEAREKAWQYSRDRLAGIDPLTARRTKKAKDRLEEARAITFRQCGERYITSHQGGWRNLKHRQQWTVTLETYVHPVIGDLSVTAIDTALVIKVLEPIWHAKPETASRVRGRLELIMDWAAARGYRDSTNNPARWRGHLDKLLPARRKLAKVKHHAALSYAEIPTFMSALREQNGIDARALEFCILTAARSGEILGARWPEFDLDAKVWTIPRERMKNAREHRIPLADHACKILAGLPRMTDSAFVFPGAVGKPLNDRALRRLVVERMGRTDVTIHGMRSSFRDWCGNATTFPREVAEAALAHRVGDAVEVAYRRQDALEKRRKLMQAWSRYCLQAPRDTNVVELAAGRR
jgi:integrase